ncbi:endonuclease/exonuclease/phosphatase family protein [Flavobacterium alkalisoli]|uniref:Endonuclease/exonuclease/phosphatase family protein n=1 Tax=Flavobacterium alkalisoli TaxID=2602769 RepID=A0A5B9FRJ9_9FLAO|nr:endonuclease/exonuclease/phosphatase family protein [Flavobacterium alkalisoli]QEE48839.1 endonuclease/exonuclease/phosphatase family protein [Flavobacterium alkalisoli]
MRRKITISILVLLWFSCVFAQGEKKYMVHTVAFYNVENLFDTINDPKTNDEEFLPYGDYYWNTEKYRQKLDNIATVLADIGKETNTEPPSIIGLAEVENRMVLEDLVKNPKLINTGYGIIHFDSPDRRGIDVALLYDKKKFRPESYKSIPLVLTLDEKGRITDLPDTLSTVKTHKYFTRSQLLVSGLLDGEEFNFIVSHWPSRGGGEKKTKPYRDAAGKLNRKIVDSLFAINPQAKIITMGDFNDGPYNNSVRKELAANDRREQIKPKELYNPMGDMVRSGVGSVAYRDSWDIFDQIILSEPLIHDDFASLEFWKAGVYNKTYITQTSGKYKGYPLRTWDGVVGYSDHFPVFIYLIKEM